MSLNHYHLVYISGQIVENLRTYFAIFSESRSNRLHPQFLSYEERLASIEDIKSRLPPGFNVLTDEPRDFSQFIVNSIVSDSGYYVVVSVPIFHENYVFEAFKFNPRPIFWKQHLLQLHPENNVIGMNVQNKDLFIETSMQILETECFKVVDSYVCPRMSKFQKDKKDSCLYNLKKPATRQNESQITDICSVLLMPHKETVIEIAHLQFQFYFPNAHTVTISCNGKEQDENLDFNNQLELENESCEIHLEDQIVRSVTQIDPPTTKNAYTTFSNWFDKKLGPIEPLIPKNPANPVNIEDLIHYDTQWRTLHHHEYHKKQGIGLYVCIGICFIVACFMFWYFCKNYKFSVTRSPPSYENATAPKKSFLPIGNADSEV